MAIKSTLSAVFKYILLKSRMKSKIKLWGNLFFILYFSINFANTLPHYTENTSAFFGQNFTHLPHFMHLLSSTTGALNPVCIRASTGQTATDGHLWFCGHRSFITISFSLFILFFPLSTCSKVPLNPALFCKFAHL